ncbi:MAG: pirin family protein [Gammaproteobacteria bacterium]|nr:pirin family protein [Gammaproteobacteria bacterium]
MTEISDIAPIEPRHIVRVVEGIPATDGAGVQLTRVIGQPALPMLDPFLLLDAFRSDRPQDYLAGFPPHPHRGFETVTYLLSGRMRHRDSTGHEGIIEPGGIQWMTAARGIVHSEMPEQENGLLEGFQLWVNLPAAHKMDPPAYQEYSVSRIPLELREGGVEVRVIAGSTSLHTVGPVVQPLTLPRYLDLKLPPGSRFREPSAPQHNAFVYVINGPLLIAGPAGSELQLQRDDLGIFSRGDEISLRAAEREARCLVVSGKPLNEPVARGGPFVMNTREELQQAYRDFEQKRF